MSIYVTVAKPNCVDTKSGEYLTVITDKRMRETDYEGRIVGEAVDYNCFGRQWERVLPGW